MNILIPLLVSLPLVLADTPGLPGPTIPDGLGVNIHFTDPRPGEMDMLAAGGFRWVRMDFAWGGTEREKGKYDFAAYERLLKALDAQKIRALFILDYSNRLYEADRAVATDAGRQAYARWAAAAVAHFKGRGVLWEIWNEPNIPQFWGPKPNVKDYAAMALAAAKAIRAVAPNEMIIGPATSTVDMKFLEGCFQVGLLEWWDAVSIHPYRQSGPESAAAEYQKLRRLLAQYAPRGKTIPIVSGEWGYSAAWKNYSADKQAKMLARQWLINLAQQIPLSIWYDWHDDGKDPHEPEHHFGTVAFEYHKGRKPVYDPKPAYLAAQTLTSTLAGYRFNKRLAVGGQDDYVLLLSKGENSALAVWTTASESRAIKIPSSPGTFQVVEHTGKKLQPLSVQEGFLTLTPTDAPLYLTAQQPNPILGKVPKVHPLHVSLMPATKALTVLVENLADTGFKGKVCIDGAKGLEVTSLDQPLVFSPGEREKRLRFPRSSTKEMQVCRLRIENVDGVTLLTLPAQRFLALADQLLAGCKVAPDGDPKVTSEQSLSLAPAPQALPDSTASVAKFSYRFGAGWKFLRVVPQGPDLRKIPGEPKGFGLWVYGNEQQGSPRLRVVDTSGQTWQLAGRTIDWQGWRFVSFELKPSILHWGGANDGTIHYPLTWDSIFLLDNTSRLANEGTLYLAGPVAIY